ncbi:MAG: protease pro-enzyme activation domain-containing protein [Limisphaerales bacterium]
MPEVLSSLAPIGRLPATNQLRLAIGLPSRDRMGLDNFVAQVSDPASPNFRHFLTREEVTARFEPTAQDYDAVKKFARTNDLAITVSHNNRLPNGGGVNARSIGCNTNSLSALMEPISTPDGHS